MKSWSHGPWHNHSWCSVCLDHCLMLGCTNYCVAKYGVSLSVTPYHRSLARKRIFCCAANDVRASASTSAMNGISSFNHQPSIRSDPLLLLQSSQRRRPEQLRNLSALRNPSADAGRGGCHCGIFKSSLPLTPVLRSRVVGGGNSRVGSMSSDVVAAAGATPSVEAKDGGKEAKTVNVVIKGKVQGVYYRDWTVKTAKELGINGWVRNLRDGSVEAVFSGDSTAVNTLIENCHTGPPAARVISVTASAWTGEVKAGFDRRPTG